VLDEDMLPSGRVRFLGMSDHRGEDEDGHHVVSLLDGRETVVKVRRKVVDATYVQSEIPSRHTPSYPADPHVRLIPPNALVDLADPADRFTVIGAGKTALDTCGWLLDSGVDPDRIRWIRSRDPWLFDRAFMQPLELVGSYMQLQARWVEAAALAEDGPDLARRLEDAGVFVRVDPAVEPLAFRGATISVREVEALRRIDHVVRARRITSITSDALRTDAGDLETRPGEVFVDCTAAGVPAPARRPVFHPGGVTIQYVTIGIVPWSAATIGVVEAVAGDDDEKNRLCPPLVFSGQAADLLELAHTGMNGLMARSAHPTIAAWTDRSRLNPAKGAAERLDDPVVAEAFGAMATHIGAALQNLARRTAVPAA
jgi:hypothetical protein